jgi:ABC-type oligopeptide transport system substrate-binding subunit
MDDTRRAALQQQAMRLLVEELPLVPLFAQVSVDAGRAGIVHKPNPRGHIVAHNVRLSR